MPDMLKPLDQILEADSIWRRIVLCNQETGIARERTLLDHHSGIEPIQLPSAMPESIRKHFDTARNLLMYAGFCTDLINQLFDGTLERR
jgi:hypothetical protein